MSEPISREGQMILLQGQIKLTCSTRSQKCLSFGGMRSWDKGVFLECWWSSFPLSGWLYGYVYWAENLQYVHSSKCMSYFTTYWSTHLFSYDKTKIQPFRSKSCDLTIFFVETPCFGTGVCNDSYIIAKASEQKEKQVMET